MQSNRNNRNFMFWAFLITCSSPEYLKADVYFSDVGKEHPVEILISNEIRKQDYPSLVNIYDNMLDGRMKWGVKVNSLGGDNETAIKIGRLLRAKNEKVTVGNNAICFSSCVYILAGAVRRFVLTENGGRVGIHRSYDPLMMRKRQWKAKKRSNNN